MSRQVPAAVCLYPRLIVDWNIPCATRRVMMNDDRAGGSFVFRY
jgi:hypothetical protein